ncbi:hypothetical protein [Gayadomonas joobiniege]|uniref:hypothetical protein n=1 Tax=Gayadomonas joobiniege TaxID=1234606 RepID=UPI00036D1E8A|nr:hypothetical protein [Gayadomonas joobiniege]
MLKHIRAKQLSVAVLAALYSTTGTSAEADKKQEDVEVIEVSGYRGSGHNAYHLILEGESYRSLRHEKREEK